MQTANISGGYASNSDFQKGELYDNELGELKGQIVFEGQILSIQLIVRDHVRDPQGEQFIVRSQIHNEQYGELGLFSIIHPRLLNVNLGNSLNNLNIDNELPQESLIIDQIQLDTHQHAQEQIQDNNFNQLEPQRQSQNQSEILPTEPKKLMADIAELPLRSTIQVNDQRNNNQQPIVYRYELNDLTNTDDWTCSLIYFEDIIIIDEQQYQSESEIIKAQSPQRYINELDAQFQFNYQQLEQPISLLEDY